MFPITFVVKLSKARIVEKGINNGISEGKKLFFSF